MGFSEAIFASCSTRPNDLNEGRGESASHESILGFDCKIALVTIIRGGMGRLLEGPSPPRIRRYRHYGKQLPMTGRLCLDESVVLSGEIHLTFDTLSRRARSAAMLQAFLRLQLAMLSPMKVLK